MLIAKIERKHVNTLRQLSKYILTTHDNYEIDYNKVEKYYDTHNYKIFYQRIYFMKLFKYSVLNLFLRLLKNK